MKFFIYTIFLSAFLLFQVQPMIAKFILPWFGGSSAVWSTCLLFFQTGLLIGYGYSHLISRIFGLRNQVKVHLVLLVLSFISIPIIPHEWMKPDANQNPVFGILKLLSLTVGFPYIMVSTTGPLLQSWFSISNPKKSPYQLYALSNLGSLIGLITYPILIEPFENLKTQLWTWSLGYILFILLCGLTAKTIWNLKTIKFTQSKNKSLSVSGTIKSLWLLLAFMGTVTLLSITNKLTQDITVVPFLWIVPLTLYLITFIIAFGYPKWYNRKVFIPAMLFSIAFLFRYQIQSVVYGTTTPLDTTIFIYCLTIFLICMVLHGELSRLKPDQVNLTLYYFMISAGGVLGGIFINLIVPFIFNGFWELYCAIAGTILITAFVVYKSIDTIKKRSIRLLFSISTFTILAGVIIVFQKEYTAFNDDVIDSSRNFYGLLKVSESNKGTINWQRMLIHGDVSHGIELMDSAYQNLPISYYGPESGIGLALSAFPSRSDSNYNGMRVGMIGLGTATIAAYGTDKDLYKYYEINSQVEVLARKYFKFISNFKGKTEIINGDGRISLERELKETGSNQYDVLAVDAFSGDVIPTHLVTREAMELYLKHIKSDGIIAFHITNKYLNLIPVMNGLSQFFGKHMNVFYQKGNISGPVDAIWVLFTENKKFLNNPLVQKQILPFDANQKEVIFWTDDYSSIWPIFL